MSNFKIETNTASYIGECSKRPNNIYYSYKGNKMTGKNLPESDINNQPSQFYFKTHEKKFNQNLVHDYDKVFFSSAPNYAYRLNQVYESGSSASTSDYRIPGSCQIKRFNPLFSDSADNYRRSHQLSGYSESSQLRGSSEGK